MTQALTARRLRFKFDSQDNTPATDVLTGLQAIVWRGTAVSIEVGLFRTSSVAIDDVSNITTLYLEIHASPRSSSPLVQVTATPATLSSANWTAGTHQSATFTLTAAQTQFDMASSSDEKRTFWLVVHAVLTGGTRITCGGAQLTVEEDGAQNDLAVVPLTNPSFRISDGELQIWNPDQSKWHTVYVRGGAGQEQLVIAGGVS